MRKSATIAALVASNIGTAFFLQWYTLAQLGAGPETDALFAGMTIPQLVLAVIGGSLVNVLVPLFSREGNDGLPSIVWTFTVLVALAFAGLGVLLAVSADYWIPWTVPGFSVAEQALTVQLTRIQLVGMVSAAVWGVQSAYYISTNRYALSEAVSLSCGILSALALVWVLPIWGISGVAWVATARLLAQTVALGAGVPWPTSFALDRAASANAWSQIRHLLVGTSLYKTEPVVDRFLLSTLPSGSISLYFLAHQLYAAGTQVISKAIAIPLIPELSRLARDGRLNTFEEVYLGKLKLLLAIAILAALFVVAFSNSFLPVFASYTRLQKDDISALWWLLLWLSGVFVGGVVGQLVASSFYAIGDTRTQTRIGVVLYAFYVPTKVFAFLRFGLTGMAISASVYWLTSFGLQHAFLLPKLAIRGSRD